MRMQRDLTRIRKSMERLVTAYQEHLITIDELRGRLPPLRQREQATHAELQSIADQAHNRTAYLRLAETLAEFLSRLRSSAENLDVQDRQRIVRLLVKEVLVGDDTIVIRHSIPVPAKPPGDDQTPPKAGDDRSTRESYLLRSGSAIAAAGQHLPALRP
jgi:site-specific DNA recombinase